MEEKSTVTDHNKKTGNERHDFCVFNRKSAISTGEHPWVEEIAKTKCLAFLLDPLTFSLAQP